MPATKAACSVPWLIILGYMEKLEASAMDKLPVYAAKISAALHWFDRTVTETLREPDILDTQFFDDVQDELENIEGNLSKGGPWVLEHIDTLRLGVVEKSEQYYANHP